jgi:hypothetical protein
MPPRKPALHIAANVLVVILKNKKMRQFVKMVFLIFLISCSEKEEIVTNKCFNVFFAGSKECNANYYDTSSEPSLQTDTYSFDLNGDNQKDISFVPYYWASPFRDLHKNETLSHIEVLVKLGIDCSICLNDLNEPDTISYGQPFKNIKKWDNSKTSYLLSFHETISEFTDSTGPVTKYYDHGIFNNVQNKYLLFRVKLQNDTIFSWFNLSCHNGFMTINNYAYVKNK